MKREKFLWPLTQSHRRALVMAKRIREKFSGTGPGKNEEAVKEMAAEVQKLYDEELQTHFWDEEKMLALYEDHVGKEEPEPQRIRKEHRLLESFIKGADRKRLLAFAELLTAHVRFEEDELFGRIEKALSEGEKQVMDALLKAAAGGQACRQEQSEK